MRTTRSLVGLLAVFAMPMQKEIIITVLPLFRCLFAWQVWGGAFEHILHKSKKSVLKSEILFKWASELLTMYPKSSSLYFYLYKTTTTEIRDQKIYSIMFWTMSQSYFISYIQYIFFPKLRLFSNVWLFWHLPSLFFFFFSLRAGKRGN